ncbi:SPOR domain-containing protein [Paenibacillus algorifonticola]|uniref:SPOR domain-containing protein n=1 Tax=Paenibacillus algorifonticola TaxID=684063 RepID=UPI003D2DD494
MNSKNRITYRFDQAGQASRSENKQMATAEPAVEVPVAAAQLSASKQGDFARVIPLYKNTASYSDAQFSPWSTQVDEEMDQLEQLIRESDHHLPDESNTVTVNRTHSPVDSSIATKTSRHVADNEPPVGVTEEQYQTGDKGAIPPFNDLQQQQAPTFGGSKRSGDAMEHGPENTRYGRTNDGQRHSPELDPGSRPVRSIRRLGHSPSWINVFLSVAGALATGALFGYLLLSLFLDSSSLSSSNSAGELSSAVSGNPASQNAENGLGTGAGAGNGGSSTAPLKTVELAIRPQTYHLLQYGVFSNSEGRDAAMEELASKGLASAAVTTADDYRVYAGMAGDRSRAIALSKMLPGTEVYVKELIVQAPEQFPFTGKAADASRFFEQTNALISMLDDLALAQLEQPILAPLGENAAKAWRAEHQKWTLSIKVMESGLQGEAGKASMGAVVQAVNTAASSLTEYDKNPSQAHLWSVQQALMEAILTQKSWFETIRAL